MLRDRATILSAEQLGGAGDLSTGYNGAVLGSGASNTTVEGNEFDGPSNAGLAVESASNNVIGGTFAAAANTFLNNNSYGIYLLSANGNTIEGNYIGVGQFGGTGAGWQAYGVYIDGSSNTVIGGAGSGAGNVISGNIGSDATKSAGISVVGGSNATTIQGNLIGTDQAGTAVVANSGSGIGITGSTNTTIGGTSPGAGNVISGNGGGAIGADSSSGVTIQGNYIGTNPDGANLSNGSGDIGLNNVTGSIGGLTSRAGNTIAYGPLMVYGSSSHVAINHNSMFGHTLGISLQGCSSSNPPGPDDCTPAPITQSATVQQISGLARIGTRVEVYVADWSREGKTFLGAAIADSSGQWSISAPYAAPLAGGQYVTATSTVLQSGTPYETSAFAQIHQVAVPMRTGWNLINLDAAYGPSTASAFVSSIDSSLGANAVTLLATYQNGRYSLYAPGYSPDFPLQYWQGIFVLSTVGGNWAEPGSPSEGATQVPLNPGWNLVASLYPQDGLQASQINSEIGTACGLQEIATYGPTGYTTWTPGSTQDLTIPSDSGFWMECTKSATWTPS